MLLLLRLHPEAELVAVEVVDVEITHAVRIVFRFFQCSGAFRLQLAVECIDIRDENIYGTMAGLALGLTGGLKVDKHAVSFHARVERRLAVSELGVKPKHLAVMLDAAQDIFTTNTVAEPRSETDAGLAIGTSIVLVALNAKTCISNKRNESSSG